MFGLSWIELFVILVVALVVIGPDKLPEVARGLGRLIRQGQKLVNEVRDTIRMEDLETRVRESSHYTPPNSPNTASNDSSTPSASASNVEPFRPIELGPALSANAPFTPEPSVLSAPSAAGAALDGDPILSPMNTSVPAENPVTSQSGGSQHPAALPPERTSAASSSVPQAVNQDHSNHP
ncbi:MAG: twin-arginine translocase TatA/TatE family subunit [Magnetococcus sp. YQC-9]